MSYENPRITDLNMSTMDVIMALGDGNPGAITVMVEMLKQSEAIDPACAAPILQVLSLDTLDCYGSDIWILYKDICGQDMENMLGVLRAIQLGIISGGRVMEAVKSVVDFTVETKSLDVDDLVKQVKEQLSDFGTSDEEAA